MKIFYFVLLSLIGFPQLTWALEANMACLDSEAVKRDFRSLRLKHSTNAADIFVWKSLSYLKKSEIDPDSFVPKSTTTFRYVTRKDARILERQGYEVASERDLYTRGKTVRKIYWDSDSKRVFEATRIKANRERIFVMHPFPPISAAKGFLRDLEKTGQKLPSPIESYYTLQVQTPVYEQQPGVGIYSQYNFLNSSCGVELVVLKHRACHFRNQLFLTAESCSKGDLEAMRKPDDWTQHDLLSSRCKRMVQRACKQNFGAWKTPPQPVYQGPSQKPGTRSAL